MAKPLKKELLGLSIQELSDLVEGLGQPSYRARQLADAVYRHGAESLEGVSNLPAEWREDLAERYTVGLPEIQKRFVSRDGTVRYLMQFADGQSVETVWMPEGDDGEQGDGTEAGDEEGLISLQPKKRGPPSAQAGAPRAPWMQKKKPAKRATICVSSQAGCAVNCQFCMTALLGLLRNLSAGEIVGQVLRVLKDHAVDVQNERVNLVFMGQGEPFLNYENFMTAVRLLVAE